MSHYQFSVNATNYSKIPSLFLNLTVDFFIIILYNVTSLA